MSSIGKMQEFVMTYALVGGEDLGQGGGNSLKGDTHKCCTWSPALVIVRGSPTH